jgi:hypothetical protein
MANKPEGLVFDLAGFTARDYATFRTGLDGQYQVFARVIKQLPDGWGDPGSAETYRKLHFKKLILLRQVLSDEVETIEGDSVSGFIFVGETVTAKEMNATTIKDQAKLLIKYMVNCPEGWGTVLDPAAFLDLPYVTFRKVWKAFDTQCSDAMPDVIPGLAFDVDEIIAEEVENIGRDIGKLMAKYAKKFPKSWGERTAESLLNLPYPVYLRAAKMFQEVMEDLGKN